MSKRFLERLISRGCGLTFVLILLQAFIAAAFLTAQTAYGGDQISYSGSSTIGTGVLDAGAVKAF